MNREIKFRAWRRRDNGSWEMFYSDDIPDAEERDEKLCYFFDIGFYTDEPIMQYTGLKDKNGKEIYEGDIVIVPWGFGGDYEYPALNAIVKWDDDKIKPDPCFVIEPISHAFSTWQDFSWNELDVIGNIYENPELLAVSIKNPSKMNLRDEIEKYERAYPVGDEYFEIAVSVKHVKEIAEAYAKEKAWEMLMKATKKNSSFGTWLPKFGNYKEFLEWWEENK